MKMEPIVSSETSAIRTQTPGNYPKRNNTYWFATGTMDKRNRLNVTCVYCLSFIYALDFSTKSCVSFDRVFYFGGCQRILIAYYIYLTSHSFLARFKKYLTANVFFTRPFDILKLLTSQYIFLTIHDLQSLSHKMQVYKQLTRRFCDNFGTFYQTWYNITHRELQNRL